MDSDLHEFVADSLLAHDNRNRLIALAGDLESLAKMPAGTVQVLGAEDALFAHLHGGAPSPKHGMFNVQGDRLTTRDIDLPAGAMAVGSVEEALAAASERSEVVYVAGGAPVYRQLLPLADRLVITEIHECYEGDTRFPEYDRSEWVERDRRGR